MREPYEHEYFNWLCAKVQSQNVRISDSLMRTLYQTEFVWFVPGDKNREEDGLELRSYFIDETRQRNYDPDWFGSPCSVLEVLIAFASRASFQTNMPAQDWFVIFLTNLGLEEHRVVTYQNEPKVRDILDNFVWRQHDELGHGGLFPLRESPNDQRKVEIWYQFCEYLEDQGLI